MAIIPDTFHQLAKRYQCDSNGYCYYTSWDEWGRWVLLAILILGAFFFFMIFSCITARRRRKYGLVPYRGTGWASYGQQPMYQQGTYYNPNGQYYQGPPPQYAGHPNQQTGVEMQPPNQTFQPPRGGDQVYSPPSDPPPGKTV